MIVWPRSLAHRGALFHPDRSSQCASHDLRRALTSMGFGPSMSRKVTCSDNAMAEAFASTLKNEHATGTYPTKPVAHAGIARYIHDFHPPTRRHSTLGNLSPVNYAQTLMAAQYFSRFSTSVWSGKVPDAPTLNHGRSEENRWKFMSPLGVAKYGLHTANKRDCRIPQRTVGNMPTN